MKKPFGTYILDRLTGDASPEVREEISLALIAYALVSRDVFVLPLVLLDSGLRGQAILDAISGTCCVGCLAKKLIRQRLETHFPEYSELTTEPDRCTGVPDAFDVLRAAFPGVEIKGVQA